MNIFEWFDSLFNRGPAKTSEPKLTPVESIYDKPYSHPLSIKGNVIAINESEILHSIKGDVLNLMRLVIEDYKSIVDDIETAKADGVPIEEIQVNLGEREALGRVLQHLRMFNHYGLDDVQATFRDQIYEATQYGNKSNLDISTVDNHELTRAEINKWLRQEIGYIRGDYDFSNVDDINSLFYEDIQLDEIGLDSLGLVELLMSAEERFNIEITNEAAVTVKTIGQAIDLILIATAPKRDGN